MAVVMGSDEQGSIFGHYALLVSDIDCHLVYVLVGADLNLLVQVKQLMV